MKKKVNKFSFRSEMLSTLKSVKQFGVKKFFRNELLTVEPAVLIRGILYRKNVKNMTAKPDNLS